MSSRTRPGFAATKTARPRAERPAAAVVAVVAALLPFLLGPFLLGGCLSTEEETRLGVFRYNSKAYYDVGEYVRAEDQCRRGLEVDSDDAALRLMLAYTLLSQADPTKLDEAAAIFADEIGFFSGDDWRLRMGYGMALQQIARERARSEDPKDVDQVADLRAKAREELDVAYAASATTKNTPADVPYGLALLDLDEGRLDLFPSHANDAIEKLKEQDKFLDVQLRQPMGVKERQRTEHELAINRARGRRIAREGATLAWERGDWKLASQAMSALDAFGTLDRSDYFNRARIREKVGEIEGAVRDYERFIALSTEKSDESMTNAAIASLQTLRAELAVRRTEAQISSGQ